MKIKLEKALLTDASCDEHEHLNFLSPRKKKIVSERYIRGMLHKGSVEAFLV